MTRFVLLPLNGRSSLPGLTTSVTDEVIVNQSHIKRVAIYSLGEGRVILEVLLTGNIEDNRYAFVFDSHKAAWDRACEITDVIP